MRAASSLVLLAAAARLAHADPTDADRAFQTGRDLLAAGKYAEACVQFETSERLDPQLGTRFNIAQCDDKLGKLVAALDIYRDLAEHDTNAQRKAIAAKLAEELAARVAHIHLRIAHRAADLVVLLDGVDVTASTDDLPVDVGHHLVATTQGDAHTRTPVEVRAERASFDVAIDAIAPPAPDAPRAPVAAPSSHHALPIALLSIGGAALAGGAVFGILAHGSWTDAQTAAAGGNLAHANELSSTASTRGDVSTVLFVAGGLAAAAGVVLYLHGRGEHATAVTATPAAGGGAVSIVGRF